MKPLLISAGLILAMNNVTVADLTCDFQHQCYHMDPTHPDKITPPPAPMYPTTTPPVTIHIPTQSQGHLCHIVLERRLPDPLFQAVEICTVTPEKETTIRNQMEDFNGGETHDISSGTIPIR